MILLGRHAVLVRQWSIKISTADIEIPGAMADGIVLCTAPINKWTVLVKINAVV